MQYVGPARNERMQLVPADPAVLEAQDNQGDAASPVHQPRPYHDICGASGQDHPSTGPTEDDQATWRSVT